MLEIVFLSKEKRFFVYIPILGHPLEARYFGRYEIESKISDVNYVVSTPDKRKQKPSVSIC